MNEPLPVRHVLIDFENLPSIDLAPLAGLQIDVMLLVGEKNKRLGIDLVEQLLASGSRVQLVRVGASGRNALDLTLAFYLGRAAVENPRAEFFILSKDGDYDAMITHVNRHGVRVARYGSIADLPFLTALKEAPTPRAPDRFGLFVAHLRANTNNRPRRRRTLLSHIKAHFGHKLTEAEAEQVIHGLTNADFITINERGDVTYSL